MLCKLLKLYEEIWVAWTIMLAFHFYGLARQKGKQELILTDASPREIVRVGSNKEISLGKSHHRSRHHRRLLPIKQARLPFILHFNTYALLSFTFCFMIIHLLVTVGIFSFSLIFSHLHLHLLLVSVFSWCFNLQDYSFSYLSFLFSQSCTSMLMGISSFLCYSFLCSVLEFPLIEICLLNLCLRDLTELSFAFIFAFVSSSLLFQSSFLV